MITTNKFRRFRRYFGVFLFGRTLYVIYEYFQKSDEKNLYLHSDPCKILGTRQILDPP